MRLAACNRLSQVRPSSALASVLIATSPAFSTLAGASRATTDVAATSPRNPSAISANATVWTWPSYLSRPNFTYHATQLSQRLFSTSRLASMGSDSSKHADSSSLPRGKSEDEWRTVLSPAQFRVLRQQGTEPAFTSELDSHYPKQGVYTCAGCDAPLYTADHKFKSGCGWPAFFDAIPGAVKRNVDRTFGMKRIEIRCSSCDGHLGHVFEGEGFPTPTDERHCVNGISLRFSDKDKVTGDGKM